MNKWQLKKICSLILALVILVQCIPAQVFAAKLPGSISEDTSERNQNVTILGEVETLRQEDTKHFRLSDGSFLAVSYGMPVHYEDDNGMWQDINNSITPDNARNTYQLNRSDVEIAFSDSSATGRLLTTSRDGMAISMSLLDTVQAVQMITPEVLQQASAGDLTAEAMSGQSLQAAEDTSAGRSASGNTYSRTSTAHIANDTASVLNLQDNQSWSVEDVVPDHLQSSLVYEEVFPNVDLMYTTYGYNIKEEIIVKREQAEYRYDFLLELDGLNATMNEDGSVSFTDASGKQFYRIPTPYMEDDNGAVSYGVTFALHETAQGVVFTVEADAQWINSEDRVFPVKIDPSFVITAGSAYEDIYSAYTMEAAPRDTTFERRNLYIGSQPYSTTNDGRYRAFLHFNNMPEIPVGSEVVNAQLSMYQCKYVKRYCTSFPIGLYEVPGGLPSEYSSYYNWFAAMTWNNSVIREPEYKADNAHNNGRQAVATAGHKSYYTQHKRRHRIAVIDGVLFKNSRRVNVYRR